jgi:CHASE2 domain-containing sensor protein
MSLTAFNQWFLGLGAQYGVNPYIFGTLYVGAIPFFLVSVAWLIRRRSRGLSITIPALCSGTFFVSAYIYLAIAGRNIPVWVWLFIAVLLTYGSWSAVRNIRRKSDAAAAKLKDIRLPDVNRKEA